MITQDAQQAIGFRKSLVSASGAQKLIYERWARAQISAHFCPQIEAILSILIQIKTA